MSRKPKRSKTKLPPGFKVYREWAIEIPEEVHGVTLACNGDYFGEANTRAEMVSLAWDEYESYLAALESRKATP